VYYDTNSRFFVDTGACSYKALVHRLRHFDQYYFHRYQ